MDRMEGTGPEEQPGASRPGESPAPDAAAAANGPSEPGTGAADAATGAPDAAASGLGATMDALSAAVERVVLGQPELVRQLMVTFLAGGHALIEGVPGTAKTLVVRALARGLRLRFGRVQFTPDLMPTDLVGVNVLDPRTSEFAFRPGPIFTDLLLADEINRAPAKTQAALLEAMQERQATVDGETHPLPAAFTVLATQNPVEFEGTYPLPEAQLDRFLLKVRVGYPAEEAEAEILDRYADGFDAERTETFPVSAMVEAGSVEALRRHVAAVHVEPPVRRYMTRIVRATREHPTFNLGASPRAGVALFLAARAHAVLEGRDFATPDDVKALALPVLRHRVMLTPEAEVEGRGADAWLLDVLATVEAPRTR